MPIHPSSCHPLKRYLTLFYGFVPAIALGLAIILALSACGRKATTTPLPATATPASSSTQPAHPAQFGTQAHVKGTTTTLPAIPATPKASTPSHLGVTAEQLKGLQVTLWHPWSEATAAAFQSILDEFNHTNAWGIQVKASGYAGFGSLEDAVETAHGSNSLPDVLVEYPYRAQGWGGNSPLADLAPYVEDPVWGLSPDQQADFYSVFWSEDLVSPPGSLGSKRLGLPYYRSAYGLFYNQTWAAELGFSSPPATPDDFRAQTCAASEALRQAGDKTALGKGGWLVTSDPAAFVGWIYAFGGKITDPAGDGYMYDTPETTQALEYLKGLQDGGCVWTGDGSDPQVAFAHRQALFIQGSLLDLPSLRAAMSDAGSTDEWKVIPFPSTIQPVVITYGPSLFITRSTPASQLAAWLVMEWLVYPPNQAKFVQQLGAYPTRQSTLSYFIHTEQANTQWAQSLMLLPQARSEPSLASWKVMHWALSDASTQLFSQQFKADQIPEIITNLDAIAEEISSQVP